MLAVLLLEELLLRRSPVGWASHELNRSDWCFCLTTGVLAGTHLENGLGDMVGRCYDLGKELVRR
jgi:hypothetical protein